LPANNLRGQVYVFWNYHERRKGVLDWQGDGGAGDLGLLIDKCAARGLFVNLRVGPYVCAEWDYGGIPNWVGFEAGIELRRYNAPWMAAMQSFTQAVVEYTKDRKLWAHQGGPIVLAQIENELDVQDDPRGAEYVEWCGALANALVPEVPWLMCNGDSAGGTVESCNGYGGASCATDWLERNGDSGRILVDQPALWTENEGGYQLWGESADLPIDYFWGATARTVAFETLQWFARGGAHNNYYMWWGGYNRGRWAAAGITNAYAVDAPLCANGMPHQPKFDHLAAMHAALSDVAVEILQSPAQYRNATKLEAFDGRNWNVGDDQRAFRYGAVAFVENAAAKIVETRLDGVALVMAPYSVAVLRDGKVLFDSGVIAVESTKYVRVDVPLSEKLVWTAFSEPVGAPRSSETITASAPIEQSRLSLGSETQYVWYETDLAPFELPGGLVELMVHADHSNGFVAFIDGERVAAAEDHAHADGPLNLTMTFTATAANKNRTLSILSESFGYNNLIGRWGASTFAKLKGLTGPVSLGKAALVDGREWRMRLGADASRTIPAMPGAPTWHRTTFSTPSNLMGKALMFDAAGLGRGHLYLNGHDLGRFWDIKRAASDRPTQQFHQLPPDWLRQGSNDLVAFDVLGGSPKGGLFTSALEASAAPLQIDAVDSPAACLD